MRDRYEDHPSSLGVDAQMIEFVAPPPPDDFPLNMAALFLKSFLMRWKHTAPDDVMKRLKHKHSRPYRNHLPSSFVSSRGRWCPVCYLVVYNLKFEHNLKDLK